MVTIPFKKAFKLAAPAACAALLAACAPYEPVGTYGVSADARVEPAAVEFSRLDVNGDGFLSRSEVAALGVSSHAVTTQTTTAAFHRFDLNGDGFLSRAEAHGMLAGIPGASFDASDRDRDGFLSLAEAEAHLRWMETRNAPPGPAFEALDVNRDGFLSRAEAEPLLAGRAGAYATGPVTYSFERLDVDRDGYLTRAEAGLVANPLTFDRYDANRDGFLSRAEADLMLRSNVGGTGGATSGSVYGPRY